MANKPRRKMPIADRAKQFMPFAALRGLDEALAQKEKIIVSRIILSEEMAEELDRRLRQLRPGCLVTAIYYSGEEYLQLTGMVARVDSALRILQIVDTRIPLDDLLDIKLLP